MPAFHLTAMRPTRRGVLHQPDGRFPRRRFRLPAVGLALSIALCFGIPSPAPGQIVQGGTPVRSEALVLLPDTVWDFAESLLRRGEYYRAVTEYRRLIHFFPAGLHARAAAVRIGEAQLYGGEAASAIAHLSDLLGQSAWAPARHELLYLRGLGFLERNRQRPYPLRERFIALALEDFRAVKQSAPRKPRLEAFSEALATTGDLPDKSPWLAGGLSALLPGAGSFYVGRYGEGTLAFLVTGIFLYATVEAFEHDDDDLGVMLGLGALAFYGGAIYAAANGAHKFNDRTRAAHLDRQRNRFGLRFERGGIQGLLELRF